MHRLSIHIKYLLLHLINKIHTLYTCVFVHLTADFLLCHIIFSLVLELSTLLKTIELFIKEDILLIGANILRTILLIFAQT